MPASPPPPSPVADLPGPDADALYARANALWQSGARAAAIAGYRAAIGLRPDHADARINLGNALCELGETEEAVAQYRAALAIRPRYAPVLYNLGNALLARGEVEAAEREFRAALALDPAHAGAHNNLGNLLRAQGQHAEAEACFRRALALRPGMAGTLNNLAHTLLAQHRPAEAGSLLLDAVRQHPDNSALYNSLGGAMLALDRPDEALKLFRRAAAAPEAPAQARFGEAIALLSLGRFAEGWAAYESRWDDPNFRQDEREYPVPLWLNRDGQDVTGTTVLLHGEQGLGDCIQFARYAPMVRALGARVVLEVQEPLRALLAPLADAVIAKGSDLPPCDWHCPLLSLPLAFGTTLETIPAAIPYLAAPPESLATWGRFLGSARRKRVGIVCSGSVEHPEDALRSIPAELLVPLLAQADIEFHLVQKDIRPADAAALRLVPGVRPHGERLQDFADTAGLLCHLDLIVAVDTSVAHLAGALGRPVWLLLQRAADFRWLRGRDDSPWYPTARLFRQGPDRRWEPVLARVAEALRDWARRG